MADAHTRIPGPGQPIDARPATRKIAGRLKKAALLAEKGFITRRDRNALARNTMIERLRNKGAEADAGLTIDTTGLSDDEFIALLRR